MLIKKNLLKMKFFFTKPFLVSCILLFMAHGSRAQYTETFETQTPNVHYFTSNGQPFILSNEFTIYSSRPGIGYGGSNRFIDNNNSNAKNQLNSIATADAKLFTVQNFWIFASIDGGNNPSSDGSLIITGKLNGVPVFTITKTNGFNNSYGANGGFTYINLVTEGGVDYSNKTINEISFQSQGNFNYLGIDNFTWTNSLVLPVSVINFSGGYQSGNVLLNWKTSCESNSSHFSIERSSDGISYKAIGKIKGAGNCSTITTYQFVDENPAYGKNYYRLVAVDYDGKSKNHGVVLIRNQSDNFTTGIYPNPSSGSSITLKGGIILMGKLYTLLDMNGKIVGNGIISGSSQSINISSFSKGNYILKLSDGQVIQWIKN